MMTFLMIAIIGGVVIAFVLFRIPYGKPLFVVSVLITAAVIAGLLTSGGSHQPDDFYAGLDTLGFKFFGYIIVAVLPFRIILDVGRNKLKWTKGRTTIALVVWGVISLALLYNFVSDVLK